MSEAFVDMFWPLMACLVLVGIHAYLGIHVIMRKVIFVDLALAQIAGLGAVYGVFIGLSLESDSLLIKGVSVLFTLVGALLFAFTRTSDERIPHEAIIGIIYAAALSMTVLVTTNLPHGADEVRQMLAGNILWVTKSEVTITALLYGVIAVIHLVFRGQFFALSRELAHGENTTRNIKLWDFLFYATFGVVVTSSVSMGGVLLVFGYLVIPSVIGVLVAHSTKGRLIAGWSSGALMSIVGVIVSYFLDLPSGPTIVVLLGLLLLALALVQELMRGTTRRQGLFHLVVICCAGVFVMVLPVVINLVEHKHDDQKSRLHRLTHGETEIASTKSALLSGNDVEVMEALSSIRTHHLTDLVPDVLPFLSAADDKKRELAVKVVAVFEDESVRAALKTAAAREKDVFIKIEMAESLLSLGDKQGFMVLREIISKQQSAFAVDDALEHLAKYAPDAPMDAREAVLWIATNFAELSFDSDAKIFRVRDLYQN